MTCKFTPLGFETEYKDVGLKIWITCKFTPLGFETLPIRQKKYVPLCVNLPRWGLKHNRNGSILYSR